MAPEHAHDLHAGHVRVAVAEIDHVRERDAFLVLGHRFVDLLVVAGAEDALADLEEELRLGGVVHGDARPFRLAVGVVDEGAGEDVLELVGDRTALDDLLEAGRIDVVLDPHAVRLAVAVDQAEPFAHAVEQLDVLPEALEVLAAELDAVALRLVEHQLHIGKDVGRVLADGDAVAHPPEFLGRLADGLDEAELLHVARREGAVIIVNERDNRFFLDHSSPHIKAFRPKYRKYSPHTHARDCKNTRDRVNLFSQHSKSKNRYGEISALPGAPAECDAEVLGQGRPQQHRRRVHHLRPDGHPN